MVLLGLDLGGTKLTTAIITGNGIIVKKSTVAIGKMKGAEVGKLITGSITENINFVRNDGFVVDAIGISVPGISHNSSGKVWAPNIPGWEDYHLRAEAEAVSGNIPVVIESDRTCYIMGEVWQGNAYRCRDAIFLSVGTGIGAGIMVNGEVMRGSHDIAGAVGWMALERPYFSEYNKCGCFEYRASGAGITALAREYLKEEPEYHGCLSNKPPEEITTEDVFAAYEKYDPIASQIINISIQYWGMALANLISIFDPELIIIGGGVFGPAWSLIQKIMEEAAKWAQPVSISKVDISPSALGGDAGVYGAGYMALKQIRK